MNELLHALLPATIIIACASPGVAAIALGLFTLGSGRTHPERLAAGVVGLGLVLSFLASLLAAIGSGQTREVDLGSWIRVGNYEVPVVFFVDNVALAFSLLAAALTALVSRFSFTYLHKEPGFVRFYVLLGLFSSGTQLISFAGALDLMFLGWELVGLSSMLFIGFFHERAEPVRSSLRAFVTYRVCDAGFLFAIVATHELLGSTKLRAMQPSTLAEALTTTQATALALLFLLAAFGKSAQLPFSGWLPRAMEGPTPSSALFYGGVSIHAGLFLMLRVWPVLDLAPIAEATGVIVGLATAIYATLVARTCSDAKGALAHATLAQVGLIFAEISLGLTTLALVHLVGHAFLRVWQYLRAPNLIHDAHRTHMAAHAAVTASLSTRAFSAALFRLRLDERLDAVVDVVVAAGAMVDRLVFGQRSALLRPWLLALIVAALVTGSSVFMDVPGRIGQGAGPLFIVGSVIALTFGLVSVVQRDLRGLFRSKVLVHLGFLLCAFASGHQGAAIFAALTAAVPVAGFGFVVSAVEQRCGSVSLLSLGGRVSAFPHLAAAFAVIGAAGVGLPGSMGFVADDLLLHAAWEQGVIVTGALIAAAVFLAIGTLRAWQRVFLGPARLWAAPDLSPNERVVVVGVILVVIITGLVPGLVLNLVG